MAYVTTRKAANLLGIHPKTIRRWVDRGHIKSIKTETGRIFVDVQDYINERERGKDLGTKSV